MGKGDSYKKIVKRIIESNNYMVIATADSEGNPWASALFYVHDKDYAFYFLSAIDSRHIKNIGGNSVASFVIFDSRQKIGQSDSVQAECKISEVNKNQLEDVIKLYVKKLFPKSNVPATDRYPMGAYTEPAEFRFFKISISKLYISGTDQR